MKQSTLISESPLILLPSLAVLVGVDIAIVLQQLHFFLINPKCGTDHEGERWIWNTYEEWQKECFPFWSTRTIRRLFAEAEEMSLVVSIQPEGAESRRKHYRLNRGMMEKLTLDAAKAIEIESYEGCGQKARIEGSGQKARIEGSGQKARIPMRPKSAHDAAKNGASCAGASISTETSTETPEPPGEPGVSERGAKFADWFKTLLPPDIILARNWQAAWGKCYDDLIRLDHRTPEQIAAVCKWARADSFWSSNFLTPLKLRQRKKAGEPLYFDTFTERMKTPGRDESGAQRKARKSQGEYALKPGEGPLCYDPMTDTYSR